MTRRFTGLHMALTMILFFGTIIAVNMTMAVLATRTFGGKVIENSYVASQEYNGKLAAARAQDRLRWNIAVALNGNRPQVILSKDGAPLAGAVVQIAASHPLGRVPERGIDTRARGDGQHLGTQPLPAGRWRLRITVSRGDDRAVFLRDVIA